MQPGGTLRYWSNPEFDQLGEEQTSSTHPELRKRDIAKMEDMMLDEMPSISLWIEPLAWGVSKRIDVMPSYGQSDDYSPGHIKFLCAA
jgi:ABC-type oligopeptide transport system substrate-binding subunit